MIKYSLRCDNDHEFEGWFSSGDEFDRLKSKGHLTCSVCGNAKISKMLMAPSVKTSKSKAVSHVTGEQAAGQSAPQTTPERQSPINPLASLPPEIQGEIVQHLRELKNKVLATAENVGDNFGEEARKMHYGESKKRGVYGSASFDEAKELWEEGIDVLPLPVLPEDKN